MKRLTILVSALLLSLFATLAPPSHVTKAQESCFPETGFCVTNPAFMEYFRVRGGVRIMGYPISRSLMLEGFEVQFFQRVVLQMQNGQVQRLNILDPNIMPMTRANQSVFPAPDPALASQAPQVGSSDYARQVVEFVRRVAPDTFGGQPVGFFNLFNTTVPVAIAFPGQTPNPDLVTLLNLEIWGLPTSNPAPDPGNGGFVYQRFQRGIMHFRAEVPVTEGILVGEYLKAVITGRSLPPDLAEDMRTSRFSGQYSPDAPGWVGRPSELQNSNLTAAFEPGTGNVTPPPAPSTPTPTVTVSPAAPTVTIQLDDPLIDSGQTIRITLIARHTRPIDWIEWEGVDGENVTDDEFSPSVDPQLARQRLSCDSRTECAQVVSVSPTTAGRYTLRARARDVDENRSAWTGVNLRVRPANTPTITPTAPATQTPTAVPTDTPPATETPVPATQTPAPTAPATIATPTPTLTDDTSVLTPTATVVSAAATTPTAAVAGTPTR
ncbi:MAG: hypothetical protein IT306_16580 [Chloroflexi bacterium]|nr:hypothetical protein [Chloroflexota bacterium]